MRNSNSLFESIWKPSAGKSLVTERRRHPRKASLIPVAYVSEGKTRKCFILNTSPGGVFIGTAGEVFRDGEILMTFAHPDTGRNLRIGGRITWVSQNGVGVEFNRPLTSPLESGRSGQGIEEVKLRGKTRKKRIRWEPSTSGDVEKYRLYWSEDGTVGYASKYVDLGKVTEVVIPDDVPSLHMIKGTVAFGITALTGSGNESDMTRITAEIDFVVPDAPTNLLLEDA